MKSKKLICLFIAIMLLCTLVLTACGPSGNVDDNDDNNTDINTPGPGDNTDENTDTDPDITHPDGGEDNTNTGGNETDSSDSALSLITTLLDRLRETELQIPMSLPAASVPVSELLYAAGLSENDYDNYVIDVAHSMAGIGTIAHQIVVYECKDAASAAQVKSIVSKTGGYDPEKWICVWPDTVIAVDAGSYVLLVAGKRDVADAAIEIFGELAGTTNEVVTFWNNN